MHEEMKGYFLCTPETVMHFVYSTNTYVVMESVNVTVEDVENFKTNPRMSIDKEDEDTTMIATPSTMIKSSLKILIKQSKNKDKSKKYESRVLKNHPTSLLLEL